MSKIRKGILELRNKYFSVNLNLASPLSPIIWIIVCAVFVVAAIMRGHFLPELSRFVDIILTIVGFQLTVFAILRIYISCVELLEYYWRKKKRK